MVSLSGIPTVNQISIVTDGKHLIAISLGYNTSASAADIAGAAAIVNSIALPAVTS